MSGNKKRDIRKKSKKVGKYNITIAVDASFEDIVRQGLNFNPAKKPEQAKAS